MIVNVMNCDRRWIENTFISLLDVYLPECLNVIPFTLFRHISLERVGPQWKVSYLGDLPSPYRAPSSYLFNCGNSLLEGKITTNERAFFFCFSGYLEVLDQKYVSRMTHYMESVYYFDAYECVSEAYVL
jgi:hypothetical protein